MSGVDNFTPSEIAHLVETRGVAKANAPVVTTLVLAVMAGAFIALGGVLSTTILSGSELGFGPTRFIAGIGFSLGLILVIVAGAELFTGNNLVVMSWVSGSIGPGRLLRNWAVVYVGNLVGALSVVAMVYLGRWWEQGEVSVGATALTVAAGKASLPFGVVFVRAILANALVCLAVWLASGGRSVIDKIFGIIFPIAAFVAAGFEHSIANMYFLPLGLLLDGKPDVVKASGLTHDQLAGLTTTGAVNNIIAATLGNIVGGAVLVGIVYWFVYLAPARLHPTRAVGGSESSDRT
ncbi:MAG: formate/nitrite transporter family protein [Actinomycetota bacterium]|nr:formate/nitrite transporter family protein [Actinomycetota bacterium]